MTTLVEAWHNRPERERALVAAGAAIIGVMLVVSLTWIPLERVRTRLSQQLPELRASIAALERDAAEVKRLRGAPSSIPRSRMPLDRLMVVNAWDRELPGVQLSVPDDNHVRLVGKDVPFSALLDWLTTAQAAHGLRVESARIDALAPGRVRADLTLTRG